jgi:hypothetical protein
METTAITYNWKDILEASEKVDWNVDDLIGGEKQLDFTKPFLPESLARVKQLDFLTAPEQRTLSQIRGNEYLCMFGLVEEFILPFVLDHARPQLNGDDYRVRALLQFAGEEAKHIHLFKRFREEFEKGFGTRCEVIGPPEAIARAVLAHHPLGVALTILHIEWMTQRHYSESVTGNAEMDPQFRSLLKHHWMEEAQHAKLDTLMVEAIADSCSPEEIERGVGDYLAIGIMLDDGLGAQTELNLDAFQKATGRTLDADQRSRFLEQQRQALRWTYLGTGMTHPKLLASLGKLGPAFRAKVEEVAPAFC